ncbi:ABC transporter ATP-binding protein [Haloechinothrix sp. LS1_15]|uniref:ABC transporter ATP-binding protein n=1 Tax=Haloechinothrix sp. LS1_15 TaxID=2652248 RepID=UPI0029470B46|nr:ABC transporter ATP-binding protein [Haloechinothrix sp. LS1_15]MDV6011493.1 ABC transporter ATP-binding protein [Haloechinothrix sp. LS1_15]
MISDDPPVIETTRLRRRYGGESGFEAVSGIDLRIERGELFALLGTNGAGKTSTMEVLEGLVAPSDGTVRVLGCDPVRQRRLVRPRMGIMLQEGGFPTDLTVAEAARMWAGTLSVPRPVATRVRNVLAKVAIDDRAGTLVKQLSGGERRRLDLALALLGDPEVLFLDEPTTGLDPESRRNTWRLIGELHAAGTTVVLTTHYLDEAEQLADRLAILHEGRIERLGTVADVVADHPSEISFDTPDLPLPELDGTTVTTGRRGITIHTHHLQRTLTQLLTWADEHGVRLPGLRASTASLETVFLSIAGDSRSAVTEEVSA